MFWLLYNCLKTAKDGKYYLVLLCKHSHIDLELADITVILFVNSIMMRTYNIITAIATKISLLGIDDFICALNLFLILSSFIADTV